VLLYFRRDIIEIASAWLASLRDPSRRSDPKARLGWYIALGTIPIVVFGVIFSHQIETGARSLRLMGTTLIVLGLVLLVAEKIGKRTRPLESIGRRDGILIGLAQACALVPGVSRSGATLTAGLLLGLDRAAAARYSFLLSIPAVVLSGLYELKDIGGEGAVGAGPTIVATILAFVVGYASIAFLLRFLVTHTVYLFVAYRIVLGAVVLVLVSTDTIR
jgi:undecaprenyl-diphosphatase